MSKSFQTQRLDVAAFVRTGGVLQGQNALAEYPRLAQEAQGETGDLSVHWQLTGGQRTAGDGSLRPSLHVQAELSLPLTCQRCLGPVQVALQADRHILFAPDEATAAALDDVSQDDVLAMSHALGVQALVEDELLMAIPLVPRHEDCAPPAPLQAQDEAFAAAQAERPHPFAALAELKTRKLQ